MAEVTYYVDSRFVSLWESPENMHDGNLETFSHEITDEDFASLATTTCDGTDLGTITKVEVRSYSYGDGDDRIDISFANPPEYETTPGTTAGWTAYVDVTDDPNIAGWTWAKIATFPGAARLFLRYDKVGKANWMHCAKVEIRVTFTPLAPPKVTQYLPGKDCPEFPHEMDLMSDKLPCPPPYD